MLTKSSSLLLQLVTKSMPSLPTQNFFKCKTQTLILESKQQQEQQSQLSYPTIKSVSQEAGKKKFFKMSFFTLTLILCQLTLPRSRSLTRRWPKLLMQGLTQLKSWLVSRITLVSKVHLSSKGSISQCKTHSKKYRKSTRPISALELIKIIN